MNHTLEETLKVVVAPYVSPQLISPTWLAHIGKVAQILPSAVTSFFGFECRLGESAPRADFLACASVAEGGREILAGLHPTTDLPETVLENPIWHRVRHFSTEWADPTSPLYEKADNVWLEFDVDGTPSEVPVPSLFFGPASPASHPHQWITQTALPLVLGNFLPTQVEQKLFECFNALPVGAEVFQIGVMLARKSEVVRICLRALTPVQIPEYLTQVGWTDQVCALEALVAKLSSLVGSINLNLDVSDRILPKIGLECYIDIQDDPRAKLEQFLDYLVETGLCLPEKRDALFAYCGYSHESRNPELWPDHLRRISKFLDGKYLSMFFRSLHHIKIVYQPNSPLEAKAYLAVNHYWMPMSLLQQQKRELQNLSV